MLAKILNVPIMLSNQSKARHVLIAAAPAFRTECVHHAGTITTAPSLRPKRKNKRLPLVS